MYKLFQCILNSCSSKYSIMRSQPGGLFNCANSSFARIKMSAGFEMGDSGWGIGIRGDISQLICRDNRQLISAPLEPQLQLQRQLQRQPRDIIGFVGLPKCRSAVGCFISGCRQTILTFVVCFSPDQLLLFLLLVFPLRGMQFHSIKYDAYLNV